MRDDRQREVDGKKEMYIARANSNKMTSIYRKGISIVSLEIEFRRLDGKGGFFFSKVKQKIMD